jgi:predicted enzyme related to lactoylglutathione lyase
MLKSIAFIMYPVRDVVRARQFYEETLGLKAGLQGNHGDKWWVEYDLPGGGCLALANFTGEPSSGGGGTVAFEVEDLDALIADLRSKGTQLVGDVVRGPRCRMITCLDSEGNAIVLHQLDTKH